MSSRREYRDAPVDDHMSVISLPSDGRLSQYHDSDDFNYQSDFDNEQWIVSQVASAPSNLETCTFAIRSENEFVMKTNEMMKENEVKHDFDSSDDSLNTTASITSQSESIQLSLQISSSGSDEYTSFAETISFHSQQQKNKNDVSNDTSISISDGSDRAATHHDLLLCSPKAVGKEHTVEDYEEYLGSFVPLSASITTNFLDTTTKNLKHETNHGDDWRNKSSTEPFASDFIDAPEGIMLIFDRILDWIGPSAGVVKKNVGRCHDVASSNVQLSSSASLSSRPMQFEEEEEENQDDDDGDDEEEAGYHFFEAKDSLLLDDIESLPELSMKGKQTEWVCEIQWFFPCWDENNVVCQSNNDSEIRSDKRKKKNSVGYSRVHLRTKRSIIPAGHDLQLYESNNDVEDTKNETKFMESVKNQPIPPPTIIPDPLIQPPPLNSTNDFENECIYISEDSSLEGNEYDVFDVADDDSLSKVLKGLDFEEEPFLSPFDETDQACILDRTATTDGDSTLSYSSFTY